MKHVSKHKEPFNRILLAALVAILAAVSIPVTRYGIPNCCTPGVPTTPAGSQVPHEHPLLPPDVFDTTFHQHVDMDPFVVLHPFNPALAHPFPLRWTAGGLGWDNRDFRLDVRLPTYELGHHFIDEWGYGFARPSGVTVDKITETQVTYRYGTLLGNLVPPAAARAQIDASFAAWSQVDYATDILGGAIFSPLRTGVAFRQVGPGVGADVEIRWEDLGGTAAGVTTVGANAKPPSAAEVVVTFDSDLGLLSWEFGPPAAVDGAELHFLTVALHELGHVLGLNEQSLLAGAVMTWIRGPGCPDSYGNPCHTAPDLGARHGIRDLYSIPTPDFGDAPDDLNDPDDYPTRLASNGARAPQLGFEWLGTRPGDGESTTTREIDTRSIDLADDGCRFSALRLDQAANVTIDVSVHDSTSSRYADPIDGASNDLFVAVWIDWNRDGDWTSPALDPNELVTAPPIELNPAVWGTDTVNTTIHFVVPPTAQVGPTWARCRLVYGQDPTDVVAYLSGSQGDEGLVPLADSPDNGGEIEDHRLLICEGTTPEENCVPPQDPPPNDDFDGDGRRNKEDNCPLESNPDQENNEGDAEGDACDLDDDNDGIGDSADDFPFDQTLWKLGDNDGDGLVTGEETSLGTDPADFDTDEDQLPDGDEALFGTDPLSGDSDKDGLLDGVEARDHRSDPLDPDSDDDGFEDGREATLGSSPLHRSSTPEHLTVPGVCSDGLDNDLDDLIDSQDPDCFRVSEIPTLGELGLACLILLLISIGVVTLRRRREG